MTKRPENSALGALTTEQTNPASADLDLKPALEIARVINAEDAKVAAAVERVLPKIAEAIDAVAAALKNGGRLIYVGAGTSGRIAALDAAECPPTFQTDPKMVQFVIAGGNQMLARAGEANEDSRALGQQAIAKLKPGKKDVIVGIAASGRTPFTIAAVEYARKRGAKTVAVACNANSALGKAAEIEIAAEVGPEIVSGSTRMKAGTAQKMILNMLTTGAMTRLGYVYGNLMVNVHLNNNKLRERGVSILQAAAGISREEAKKALKAAGNSVPRALVMLQSGVSRHDAEALLKSNRGNVRQSIANARSTNSKTAHK